MAEAALFSKTWWDDLKASIATLAASENIAEGTVWTAIGMYVASDTDILDAILAGDTGLIALVDDGTVLTALPDGYIDIIPGPT